MNLLYLWLNIGTLGTLFLSFDKKVAYYQYFKALFISMLIVFIVFIPWDIYFTGKGIWGFNDKYITGIKGFGLPIEEWLFFFTVPYACTLIHFSLIAYRKNRISLQSSKLFWYLFGSAILLTGAFFLNQSYTFTAFISCGIVLLIINRIDPNFMKDYLRTYAVSLIPFFIVNSTLTGSFTEEPIVWYNPEHIIGLRIGTIPIEDTIYNMLLLLIITYFTHLFHSRTRIKS